jgi:hypothetical protein
MTPLDPALHPNNLPRDFVQAMAVCITAQAFGNEPIHVHSIFDGLYGMACTTHKPTVDAFINLLHKMHANGLISTVSDQGTLILTDKGDEAATTFRNLWEGAGVLDLTDLLGDTKESL